MRAVVPLQRIRRLTGFGFNSYADGYVFRPSTVEDIWKVFELARASGHQVVLRGAARSYGDAAIGSECLVLDLTRLNQILSWDATTGIVEVEPGVTLEDLWKHCLPSGWWPPVVSGTSKVTLGGALAMNIHGKNNFAKGTLGEHVLELDMLAPNGSVHTAAAGSPLLEAVVGSAGLLGIITRVRLQMKRVYSGNVRVHAICCANWDEQFKEFDRLERSCEYVVSWIDCFARGDRAGRGLIHGATHLEATPDDSTLHLEHQELPSRIMGVVPKAQVWRALKLLNHRAGMKMVNATKFALARATEHGKVRQESLARFNFLLDHVPGWERAYEPGGLAQCQFFIPIDRARQTFDQLIELQQQSRMESFLGVMKRHRPDSFLISHGVDGYSLALDFKIRRHRKDDFRNLAARMTDLALKAGGRFYLAKDSTLTASQAHEYLGMSLVALQKLKEEFDPEHLLTSNLARRLELL